MAWLTDPWSEAIVQRAFLEVALLGIAGGALGCWIVLYSLSYSAESLAHGLFPGLVVDSVLETLRALGWSDSPVWVTEWGVNVTPGMSQADVTSWLVRGLRYLLCTPNVQLVTLHALTDDNQVEHFGLLKANGESSMVGDALLSALKSWEGCERR